DRRLPGADRHRRRQEAPGARRPAPRRQRRRPGRGRRRHGPQHLPEPQPGGDDPGRPPGRAHGRDARAGVRALPRAGGFLARKAWAGGGWRPAAGCSTLVFVNTVLRTPPRPRLFFALGLLLAILGTAHPAAAQLASLVENLPRETAVDSYDPT